MSSESALPPSRTSPGVPGLVRLLVLAVLVAVPIRVLGTGFFPPDDALRHAAKVVSGKTWPEILVLRGDMVVDPHPGWHALLGLVHAATGAGPRALVIVAVVGLFAAVSAAPVLVLRRPEAWLLAWLGLAVFEPSILVRFLLGRPFLMSLAALVVLCLLWPRLAGPRLDVRAAVLATLAVALAAWTHPSWYLFALFLAAVAGAGEVRAALRLVACVAAGVLLAAGLSGHFLAYLHETARHPLLVLGQMDARTLVSELRPNAHPPYAVVALLALLVWRAARGRGEAVRLRDPLLVLAGGGWLLGFVSLRFWSDWGLPAALVWAALQISAWLEEEGPPATAWRRLGAAAVVAVPVVLASTADVGGRFDPRIERTYLPLLRPEARAALPDAGGILYSPDVLLFHQLFYQRPRAPWRYMVGFEPGLLPPGDLAVYREFLGTGRSEALRPWVLRMREADRMVLLRPEGTPPPIAELRWAHLGGELWSGRLGPASSPP